MVIVGIILSAMTQRMVFIIPGAAAVVVYPLLGIVFWRCPHCKKNLPIYRSSERGWAVLNGDKEKEAYYTDLLQNWAKQYCD